MFLSAASYIKSKSTSTEESTNVTEPLLYTQASYGSPLLRVFSIPTFNLINYTWNIKPAKA